MHGMLELLVIRYPLLIPAISRPHVHLAGLYSRENISVYIHNEYNNTPLYNIITLLNSSSNIPGNVTKHISYDISIYVSY